MVIGSAGVRKTVGFGIAPEIKNGILIGGHSDFRVNGNRVAISIGDMVSIAGLYDPRVNDTPKRDILPHPDSFIFHDKPCQ